MTKAVFYISDDVQEKGYRLYIIEKILNSDLEGGPINLPDGRIKVLLEGERERIIQFCEELKKEKPELVKNSAASNLNFDAKLVVPAAMRSSQGLFAGQLGKGVGYLASMDKKLDSINNNISGKLDKIGDKLDKVVEKL